MAARKRKAKRGSEKLLKSNTLDIKELESLTALSKRRGVKVVDWCILGQPSPDGVCGSVHVGRAGAGKLIADMLKFRKLRLDLEIFPLGIPAPKSYEIRFRRR